MVSRAIRLLLRPDTWAPTTVLQKELFALVVLAAVFAEGVAGLVLTLSGQPGDQWFLLLATWTSTGCLFIVALKPVVRWALTVRQSANQESLETLSLDSHPGGLRSWTTQQTWRIVASICILWLGIAVMLVILVDVFDPQQLRNVLEHLDSVR